MPDLLAKGVAATVAFLLVAVVGILVFTSNPPAGAYTVEAEFDNAFPLIEGMHVRVDGAIAGSVGEIEVNDRGNAQITLSIADGIEEPTAAATAAIRQQDTTGDSYVAYDPGVDSDREGADEPLGPDGIVCSDHTNCPNTLVSPRLDDLLNAFGPAERAGIQLMLVEISKALDERGEDVNGAALDLREGLQQANVALAQVNEQNAALRRLIDSSDAVLAQAAGRKDELAGLTESLATLTRTTAAEGAALDAGLERLPETTRRAESLLLALGRAAEAGRPLAIEVNEGAPLLASAIDQLPGFLEDGRAFLGEQRPILDLTREVLRAALPTLKIGSDRLITGTFDLTGATADLLNAVLGGEDAFPALFGDDSYGEPGAGSLDRAGFGAVAVEPGNLPGYPQSQADRRWLRVSAVFNCEVFGVPVEPGCLADVIGGGGLPIRGEEGLADEAADAGDVRQGDEPGGAPAPEPGGGDGGLGGILDDLPGLGNEPLNIPEPVNPQAVQDLLDFLQG